jgi:hypothetical protein
MSRDVSERPYALPTTAAAVTNFAVAVVLEMAHKPVIRSAWIAGVFIVNLDDLELVRTIWPSLEHDMSPSAYDHIGADE